MGKQRARWTPNPAVAVGYVRVSKDDQKLSPQSQAKMIETYAREHGLALVAICLDLGVCSADEADQRPGLSQALDLVREYRAGTLICAKRDRLGRDVWVVSSVERMLSQGGAVVASAAGEANGSTPADAFMRHVIDGAAEYERALIRSRTKAALAVKRDRGEKTGGGVKYGYALGADGTHLVPIEHEQAVIAKVRALRATGMSLAKVAAALASDGIVARSGRAFVPMQVARML